MRGLGLLMTSMSEELRIAVNTIGITAIIEGELSDLLHERGFLYIACLHVQ
jgi:hypothetical protein